MDQEFADLIPMFVSEARERLERLATLVPAIEEDQGALAEVRRELHTLKGAGRMMQLEVISTLCHAAEDYLHSAPEHPAPLVMTAVDALSGMIDAIAESGEAALPDELVATLRNPAGTAAVTTASASAEQAIPRTSDDVRIDAATAERLADRATRLRILTLGAGAIPARLQELARLAERGAREPHPDQVLAVLATSLRSLSVWVESGHRRLQRAAENQLDATLDMQLQPLKGPLLTLARHARDLARSLGKDVRVDTIGEKTRLDRRIIRELEEGLLHLVRNAVDHGIETPAQRRAAGKSETAVVTLSATTNGRLVRLEVSDDGGGVDPEAVARAALERGLVDASAAAGLSPQEALRLLFLPGFSTRAGISEVSGRGVGLDAVLSAVHRLGGRVDAHSEPGRGTRFTIEVPTARRGELLAILRVGQLKVAIARRWIGRVGAFDASQVIERDGRTWYREDRQLIPLVALSQAFDQPVPAQQILLHGEIAGQRLCVAADGIDEEVEVLVHTPGRVAHLPQILDGVALLPSGDPIGVLSLTELNQTDLLRTRASAGRRAAAPRLQVLLVDDSLVTREMERRLLEDAGFAVTTAGDASVALARLGEAAFECVVADIEMPGMDGLELTRRLRGMQHLAQIPVIIVSTRDRPEDRLAALEAGADAYFSKRSLDAAELVGLVRRLGGRR